MEVNHAIKYREKERTRRQNELSDMIMKALVPPSSGNASSSASFPGTRIAKNIEFASAAEVIKTSKGLIAEYDRIDGMVRDWVEESASPAPDDLEADVKAMKQLIDLGHSNATRKVKKLMNVKGTDEGGKEEEENVDEDGTMLDYGLERTLRYAERGVKRIVKGIPMESELEVEIN